MQFKKVIGEHQEKIPTELIQVGEKLEQVSTELKHTVTNAIKTIESTKLNIIKILEF